MNRRLPTLLAGAVTLVVATSCAAAAPAPPAVIALVDVPGGVAASSPTHGPALVRDGRASGFRRDELGAALAATHLAPRVSTTADPEVAAATLTEQCWGDLGVARARLAAAQPGPDAPPRVSSTPQALHYRLVAGDPDGEDGAAVVVSLLAATEQAKVAGGLSRTDLTLRWTGGDWRLRVPVQRPSLHPSTDGYALLGGAP